MSESSAILDDIRVLDLSEAVAGPYCTKLLAGLGAEVIKVERPGRGDIARRLGPFTQEVSDAEQSALFLYLNTSKKSITLNVQNTTGASILRHLAQNCDILVESFSPGHLAQFGLSYADLEPLNPSLIYTSVTPFGQSGPYRDYKGSELITQAVGAVMHTVGLPDREPLKIGGYAALYTAGMSAFSATLLALHVRDTKGYGQHVDVSGMETMTVAQIHASIQHQFGRTPARRNSTLVQAQDGWVHPGLERGVGEDTWARVCELIGQPALAEDARFHSRETRREHQQALMAIIGAWAATQPKEDIYHALQALRSVAGYVATVEDLFASRQFVAREFFQAIDHPRAGEARYPGAPFTIQDTTWRHTRAPFLGEHNMEIYSSDIAYTTDDLSRLYSLGII
jgi:crotonobetainyl-CoA:carnitine CoA-transferase CaiB-like acyl-CoA transferase